MSNPRKSKASSEPQDDKVLRARTAERNTRPTGSKKNKGTAKGVKETKRDRTKG